MAKDRQAREKRHIFSDRRFHAKCANCTAYFEAEKEKDTQRYCSCGNLLAWNDNAKLRGLEGKRVCKKS